MTRRRKNEKDKAPAPPEPIDVVDGVPDASRHRSLWKYVALAVVFVAWAAFLLYCGLAGNP